MESNEKLEVFLRCAKEKESLRIMLQRTLLSATEAIDSYTEIKINEFVANAIEVHKGLYLYDALIKANTLTDKIKVICPIHGEFSTTRKNHLAGEGCPKCLTEGKSVAEVLHPEDVYKDIESTKQKLEHIRIALTNFILNGDILSLQEIIGHSVHSEYVKGSKRVEDGLRKCPVHGVYSLIPEFNDEEHHCIKCAMESVSGTSVASATIDLRKTKPNIVYIVQVKDEEQLFKIGITSNITRRLRELRNVKLICSNTTNLASKVERSLHKKYEEQNVYYEKASGGGNTEYFKLTDNQVDDIVQYIKNIKIIKQCNK